MNIKDLSGELRGLMGDILDDSAQIIAHTASEYYRDSFSRKAFDGVPWVPGRPKRRGSLLIQTGALANSIHPTVISRDRVVISAGSDKIPYARAHNEGLSSPMPIRAHQRRSRKGGTHPVREHTRMVTLPKRQYMGQSMELDELIHERLQGYVDDRLRQ